MRTSLKSYCCEPPRRANIALIAPLLLVSIGFDLPPAEAQTSGPVADACTEDYPCSPKEGDCDSNTECTIGLICAADVGSGLGYRSDVDVCWIGPAGGKDSCTTAAPCWAGMGDCDEDSHCDSKLHCVHAAGRSFGWTNDVGVCMPHQWVRVSAGQKLPTGAVPGGYEAERSLYVCRTRHANNTHIGKLVFGKCYFGFEDKEKSASEYEVMVYTGADFKSQYAWIQPDKPDALPARAVKGGPEGNSDSLYLCRARYKEGLHPGKVEGSNCHITYGGDEIKSADYAVLVLL